MFVSVCECVCVCVRAHASAPACVRGSARVYMCEQMSILFMCARAYAHSYLYINACVEGREAG